MKKITAWIIAAMMVPTAVSASAGGSAFSFTVTEIRQSGMVMGRCTAPAGWKISGQAMVCTTGQSMENPWMLYVTATGGNGGTMAYCSERNFIQILRWDGGTGHQEGVYNATFHTPMLAYRDAAGFCDYTAGQFAHGGAKLTLVEENRFPDGQELFRRKEQLLYNQGNALASLSHVHVDGVACSACWRRYRFDFHGVPSYICVMAGVEAVQSTAKLPGDYVDLAISTICWSVPFTYIMVCPVSEWDACGPAFTQFVENTTVSDEFRAANDKLANELISIVTGRPDLTSGISRSENVMRAETAGGDSYSSDRYSDYLFDQNDYTLSDGSHVKVSTAYDYVYEGDYGNVYYSDSPFAQPGGSVQLYPNR